MNKIQMMTSGASLIAAQAMAAQVVEATNANSFGVVVLVAPRGADTDLFYHISTTGNRALESTTLLCSATILERLTAHTKGFIENLAPRGVKLK